METPRYQTLVFFSFCSLLINAFASLHEVAPVSEKLGVARHQQWRVEGNPVLSQICKSTDYVDLCISSIKPLIHGKTDTVSVLEQAIKVAINNAKTAVAVATKISTIPNTPPDMKSIASDCKDSYEDALDNYQKALEALGIKDVGTMNSMLSAAITDSSDCDDRLSGNKSPLLDFDSKMKQMTSNCLAIVSLVKM
ncbi:unnamed protein product [Camellia sinensis]|uniref:Pectinesterase inhibitor domain-containing protein n=1 Tax=Camellia sinensis var. sinensis TaxID=542762 RepID=A0A4S4ENI8_CAMSN|nr:pectinesterase 3 [Camellia sinensis]THG18259.1 hypothetical protein TEA_017203 [Camellia sinensis var. sinensis]